MPADKLVLLCPRLEERFTKLAAKYPPASRYAHCVHLNKTEFGFPVQLYCGGSRDGNNKLVFDRVAELTVDKISSIVRTICGDPRLVNIYRIDWAVDILNISAWQFAMSCRIPGVQTSKFYRSRTGTSFYPQVSREKTILIYDRLAFLRSIHDPTALGYERNHQLTRIEVQLRAKGVPIRPFSQIHEYRELDLLHNVTFLKFRPFRKDLKSMQLLAAEGLQALVREVGLQNALKRFSPAESSYLIHKFFEPDMDMPDVRSLMQSSVQDWLENRRRFPRVA